MKIEMFEPNVNCRLCLARGIKCWDCKIEEDKNKGYFSNVKPKPRSKVLDSSVTNISRDAKNLSYVDTSYKDSLIDEIKAIKDVLVNCVAKELRDIKLKQKQLELQILELNSRDHVVLNKLACVTENLINNKIQTLELKLSTFKKELELSKSEVINLRTKIDTMFEKDNNDIIPELNPSYTSSTIFSKDNSAVIIAKMFNLMHRTNTGFKTLFNNLEHSQALKSSNIKQEVLDCVYNLSLGYDINQYNDPNLRPGLKNLYNIVKNILNYKLENPKHSSKIE